VCRPKPLTLIRFGTFTGHSHHQAMDIPRRQLPAVRAPGQGIKAGTLPIQRLEHVPSAIPQRHGATA